MNRRVGDSKRLNDARVEKTAADMIVPFERLNDAYRLVAPPDVLLVSTEFGQENVFSFDVRASRADEFRRNRFTPA